MDWFPLFNALRIALISTALTVAVGLTAAYYIARTPRLVKGVLDVILTLPLVLPPTVIGFFLLKILGPDGAIGLLADRLFGARLVMTWTAAIAATGVVTFPLMYRTARGAIESFDTTLIHAGQTLGMSNTAIFWTVLMPACRPGILAGTVLSFARALGEYGATSMVAGYIPGRTATIATTVYQLWRTGDDAGAYSWVAINLLISLVVLVLINLFEQRQSAVRRPVSGG